MKGPSFLASVYTSERAWAWEMPIMWYECKYADGMHISRFSQSYLLATPICLVDIMYPWIHSLFHLLIQSVCSYGSVYFVSVMRFWSYWRTAQKLYLEGEGLATL